MSHAYNYFCGCDRCCRAEESREREIESYNTPSKRRWRKPLGCAPYNPQADILVTVRRYRPVPKWSAAFPMYLHVRAQAMRPVKLPAGDRMVRSYTQDDVPRRVA